MNIITIAVILLTWITVVGLTNRSSISPTRKTLIYVSSVLMFPIGVFLFIAFKAYQKPVEIDPTKREVPPIL